LGQAIVVVCEVTASISRVLAKSRRQYLRHVSTLDETKYRVSALRLSRGASMLEICLARPQSRIRWRIGQCTRTYAETSSNCGLPDSAFSFIRRPKYSTTHECPWYVFITARRATLATTSYSTGSGVVFWTWSEQDRGGVLHSIQERKPSCQLNSPAEARVISKSSRCVSFYNQPRVWCLPSAPTILDLHVRTLHTYRVDPRQ
jgi:hypothetical protein